MKRWGPITDYDFVCNEASEVLTPALFMPLYIEMADPIRAEQMNEIAKKHFLPGMPTVAYDSETYSNEYWRGPCWLNVAYFAAKGLKKYGFDESANTIRDTILDRVDRDGIYIHENYDAVTGDGLCCKNFSWSCVFVRLFILDF